MKKCRQCGMLSADTAVVCRHCNMKFSEDDKPIVVKAKKKKSIIFTIISVGIAIIALAVFVLYQTGVLDTWIQAKEKEEVSLIAEEFVKADYARDVQKIKSYMFDEYIAFHEENGTFSLKEGEYNSTLFLLAPYSQSSSIKIVSVNAEFLRDEFEIYSEEMSRKYSVSPAKVVSVTVVTQITDGEFTQNVTAPLTLVKINREWFVMTSI